MGGDLAQGAQGPEVPGADGGCAGEPILERGEDFDALDGVDAEVGIHPHVEFKHFDGIAGLLAHYGQKRFRDVRSAHLEGRGHCGRCDCRCCYFGVESRASQEMKSNLAEGAQRTEMFRADGGGPGEPVLQR